MNLLAPLDALAACFARLPGVGRRSAERMALHLAGDRDGTLRDLAAALDDAARRVRRCARCGALTRVEEDPCRLCADPGRDRALLCVVEEPADVLRIEQAGGFRGRYHVLGGRLSPMQGAGPEQLRLDALLRRLDAEPVEEVILALNTDVESEATAAFLRERLAGRGLRLTRPALGIPAGSGVAYSDAVTLARALHARQAFGAEAAAARPPRAPAG